MRRPINWFVFCLSLAFLFANLSFGRKPVLPVSEDAPAVTAQVGFSHVMIEEPAPTQFGYVRPDGSFVPLARQTALSPDADSKVPARF